MNSKLKSAALLVTGVLALALYLAPNLYQVLTSHSPQPVTLASTPKKAFKISSSRWEGTPTTTPTVNAPKVRPTKTPTEKTPTTTPPPPCPTSTDTRYRVATTIDIKGTTATVSWAYTGDPHIVRYEVGWHIDGGNIKQREAPITWKTLDTKECKTMEAVFSNLETGNYHLFMITDYQSLEDNEIVERPEVANTFFRID